MKSITGLKLRSILNLSVCLIALTFASCSSNSKVDRSIAGHEVATPHDDNNSGYIPPTGAARSERSTQY